RARLYFAVGRRADLHGPKWMANRRLRSDSDAIDSRVALDAAQRRVELLDILARQQLANAGRRVERFRQTDFACIGERLHPRGYVHGLAEIVEILVEGHGD